MDLSTPSDVYSQPDLDTFWTLVTDAGWDPSNVCSAITIHTHSHSNAGNMPGIEVGDVEYAGGKIVLKDFATTRQGTWEWRLVWDRVAGSGSTTNTEVGACVEKLADNPSTDDDHSPAKGRAAAARWWTTWCSWCGASRVRSPWPTSRSRLSSRSDPSRRVACAGREGDGGIATEAPPPPAVAVSI